MRADLKPRVARPRDFSAHTDHRWKRERLSFIVLKLMARTSRAVTMKRDRPVTMNRGRPVTMKRGRTTTTNGGRMRGAVA
jgi:hypothetical protein